MRIRVFIMAYLAAVWTYALNFVPSKLMQLIASNTILLAREKLRGHGTHSTAQQLAGRARASAVDQGKEGVTALPVQIEVVGDGVAHVPW